MNIRRTVIVAVAALAVVLGMTACAGETTKPLQRSLVRVPQAAPPMAAAAQAVPREGVVLSRGGYAVRVLVHAAAPDSVELAVVDRRSRPSRVAAAGRRAVVESPSVRNGPRVETPAAQPAGHTGPHTLVQVGSGAAAEAGVTAGAGDGVTSQRRTHVGLERIAAVPVGSTSGGAGPTCPPPVSVVTAPAPSAPSPSSPAAFVWARSGS